MIETPGIAHMPEMGIESGGTERKLGHLQTPQIDGPGGIDALKDSRRLIRHEPASNDRAPLTGTTTPVKQVLVCHGYATQRTKSGTRGSTEIDGAGRLQRLFRVAGHHAIQTRTDFGKTIQGVPHKLLGCDLAAGHRIDSITKGETLQMPARRAWGKTAGRSRGSRWRQLWRLPGR
jgi:hypothetical protein